jgi:hypothetical protein
LRQYNKAAAERTGKNAIKQPAVKTNTQAVGEATFNQLPQNAFGHRDQIAEAFSFPIHEMPQRSM